MKQEFNINYFEGSLLRDDTITAFAENKNKFSQEEFVEITINVEEFKDFATGEDMFDFCIDFFDPHELDGHGQRSGKISWEEYCHTTREQKICEDLAQFLTHKNSKSNGTKLHRRTLPSKAINH